MTTWRWAALAAVEIAWLLAGFFAGYGTAIFLRRRNRR